MLRREAAMLLRAYPRRHRRDKDTADTAQSWDKGMLYPGGSNDLLNGMSGVM